MQVGLDASGFDAGGFENLQVGLDVSGFDAGQLAGVGAPSPLKCLPWIKIVPLALIAAHRGPWAPGTAAEGACGGWGRGVQAWLR